MECIHSYVDMKHVCVFGYIGLEFVIFVVCMCWLC